MGIIGVSMIEKITINFAPELENKTWTRRISNNERNDESAGCHVQQSENPKPQVKIIKDANNDGKKTIPKSKKGTPISTNPKVVIKNIDTLERLITKYENKNGSTNGTKLKVLKKLHSMKMNLL